MNIASHARGLLAELAGSVRLNRDNADDIRAQIRGHIDAARKAAIAEQAATKDPREIEDYASLLADLDAFEAADKLADKPTKQTAAAQSAPEKA